MSQTLIFSVCALVSVTSLTFGNPTRVRIKREIENAIATAEPSFSALLERADLDCTEDIEATTQPSKSVTEHESEASDDYPVSVPIPSKILKKVKVAFSNNQIEDCDEPIDAQKARRSGASENSSPSETAKFMKSSEDLFADMPLVDDDNDLPEIENDDDAERSLGRHPPKSKLKLIRTNREPYISDDDYEDYYISQFYPDSSPPKAQFQRMIIANELPPKISFQRMLDDEPSHEMNQHEMVEKLRKLEKTQRAQNEKLKAIVSYLKGMYTSAYEVISKLGEMSGYFSVFDER